MTQKLALVTGGLHRVGAAISARLAREPSQLRVEDLDEALINAFLDLAFLKTL